MRIVIAIDSFKGSISSLQAGNAVKDAADMLGGENEVFVRPLADGGEGTVEALCSGMGGTPITISVTGPRLTPVMATYCILDDGITAVIEMAAAAGLTLLSQQERNPLETTTYGVGEMIADAIFRGCRRFIVGIGGSATNDGGTGMLSALGYSFLDENGQLIPAGAKGLEQLAAISTENVLPELKECSFRIACDVDNPLCGRNGCSAVYGPQKGASDEDITKMDDWLCRYAQLTKTVYPAADAAFPGAGAAGGLGFAFSAFLNARLEPGVQIVLDETQLEAYIKDADLVITGEGRLDAQTVMGKAPVGVAGLAKKYGKPVVAFCGCATEDATVCNDHGIDAYFPIQRGIITLEEAMQPENAIRNLKATAYQVLRLLRI